MKRAVVFKHGGGELANQLWNAVSVFAFAKETGREFSNPSFYEYGSFFETSSDNWLMRMLFVRAFRADSTRRNTPKKRFWKILYQTYVTWVKIVRTRSIISSVNSKNTVTYLPPTSNLEKGRETCDTLYFEGWLFRNPIGLEKYRDDIRNSFKPDHDIEQRINATISRLRLRYTHVVGVHIRQGDYMTWKGGAYYVPPHRAAEILREYLNITGRSSADTCFIIASDGAIDPHDFSDLNISISKENAVTDLFLLASCDIILGSNSSFCDFSAWWGNIPHIVLQNEPIDWEYYKDKKTFFENRYCTMTQY